MTWHSITLHYFTLEKLYLSHGGEICIISAKYVKVGKHWSAGTYSHICTHTDCLHLAVYVGDACGQCLCVKYLHDSFHLAFFSDDGCHVFLDFTPSSPLLFCSPLSCPRIVPITPSNYCSLGFQRTIPPSEITFFALEYWGLETPCLSFLGTDMILGSSCVMWKQNQTMLTQISMLKGGGVAGIQNPNIHSWFLLIYLQDDSR